MTVEVSRFECRAFYNGFVLQMSDKPAASVMKELGEKKRMDDILLGDVRSPNLDVVFFFPLELIPSFRGI